MSDKSEALSLDYVCAECFVAEDTGTVTVLLLSGYKQLTLSGGPEDFAPFAFAKGKHYHLSVEEKAGA